MKQCLIVSPLSFYSWHTTISQELEKRGYQVELINDEYPEGIWGLLIGKFFNKLSRKLTFYKTKKKFDNQDTIYDLILVFKGRGVSPKLVELFKQNTKKIIGYNFDSFAFFDGSLDWYHLVDNFYTFDFLDSEEHGISQVDLFTDNQFENIPEKTIDISCLVKNHSDRLQYLENVYSALGSSFSFNIYIFEKNIFTLFRGFVRNPKLMLKWRKSIHLKSLSFQEYTNIIASSKYTLDYAHPSQTGLTMRTFQAASCATGLITNNSRINESSNFKSFKKIVFKINDDSKELRAYLSKEINVHASPMVRTVADFMDDLLDE